MNRAEYRDARRGYRLARRRDAEWREPEVWAYRERTLTHQIPARPDFAIRYIAQFPLAISATFFRRQVDEGRGNRRLAYGLRPSKLIAAPVYGDYSGLILPKRVAVRSAQRQIEALDAARVARYHEAALGKFCDVLGVAA